MMKNNEKEKTHTEKDSRELAEKGGNLLRQRNFEEAEEEFREAIKINPNLAIVHNNLGNLLRN